MNLDDLGDVIDGLVEAYDDAEMNMSSFYQWRITKMTSEATITYIGIIDGMAGIEDGAGNGDACDLPATFAAYEVEMRKALALEYPGVEVGYRWVNSNQGIKVDILEGDYDPDQYDEIVGNIQRAAEDVYQSGNFWVAA
jgi:hypothetical protein